MKVKYVELMALPYECPHTHVTDTPAFSTVCVIHSMWYHTVKKPRRTPMWTTDNRQLTTVSVQESDASQLPGKLCVVTLHCKKKPMKFRRGRRWRRNERRGSRKVPIPTTFGSVLSCPHRNPTWFLQCRTNSSWQCREVCGAAMGKQLVVQVGRERPQPPTICYCRWELWHSNCQTTAPKGWKGWYTISVR
jgi:hypothetical protein